MDCIKFCLRSKERNTMESPASRIVGTSSVTNNGLFQKKDTQASMPSDTLPDSNMFSDRMMFDSFSNAFHEAQALSFAGNLMDKDHEAIERLKQLGFSDHKAIEAYFVCERNENAAADYLFSQNFE